MRKPRKNYSPSERVAILRRHLIDRAPTCDLCDEYQLSPNLFYVWHKICSPASWPAVSRRFVAPDRKLEAARERR
jgi:transposase